MHYKSHLATNIELFPPSPKNIVLQCFSAQKRSYCWGKRLEHRCSSRFPTQAEILQPPIGSLVQCPKLHSGLVKKFANYITVLAYYAQFAGNFLDNARIQVSELKKLEEWWLQNFSCTCFFRKLTLMLALLCLKILCFPNNPN